MQIVRNVSEWPEKLRAGAVAIGNFDGVHLGHARIVERLMARARQLNGPAVVFTFDPHPVRLLRPAQAPPPLTWTERKAELLAELGVDFMVAYPTDDQLLQLSAAEFFERIVLLRLDARAMVEGSNFYFGHNRLGTIEVLKQLTAGANLSLEVVEPVEIEGQAVSSSRVRTLLLAGRIAEARSLLTRPYRLRGMVTHGARRGNRIGFPTANLDAIDTILPAAGVYAGRAVTREGPWPAAINIGPNPTFGEQAFKVEVHLIDWNGNLYGEPLEVDFIDRLRDIQRFDGVESLVAQLKLDVAQAAAVVGRDE